ncbi:hypothetical protein D5S17_07090 [Pseudonocardiaceae bacterium YIM PH 21723]|nr:hypothetical protein D5S17_07090 [Pseudonocardiaceae bacterium YIM PH 21723]
MFQARKLAVALAALVVLPLCMTGLTSATPLPPPNGQVANVAVTVGGKGYKSGDIGGCTTAGPQAALVGELVMKGIATYGPAKSFCRYQRPNSSIMVTGAGFELHALAALGGPDIRMTNYKITCDNNGITGGAKSVGTWESVSGLPGQPTTKDNQTFTVEGGSLKAKLVFNEILEDDSAFYKKALLHVTLSEGPESSPRGELFVGKVDC